MEQDWECRRSGQNLAAGKASLAERTQMEWRLGDLAERTQLEGESETWQNEPNRVINRSYPIAVRTSRVEARHVGSGSFVRLL
jgi:hypothetical protein